MADHENSNADLHLELDKLEHELRSIEFNRPYDMGKIRELAGKVYQLKTKLAESELAFQKEQAYKICPKAVIFVRSC